MNARCRSCDAHIIWARNEQTERLMPLDAKPALKGTLLLDTPSNGREPTLVTSRHPLYAARVGAGDPLYVSHFATCPHAEAHRSTNQLGLFGEKGPSTS